MGLCLIWGFRREQSVVHYNLHWKTLYRIFKVTVYTSYIIKINIFPLKIRNNFSFKLPSYFWAMGDQLKVRLLRYCDLTRQYWFCFIVCCYCKQTKRLAGYTDRSLEQAAEINRLKSFASISQPSPSLQWRINGGSRCISRWPFAKSENSFLEKQSILEKTTW